MWDIHTVQVPLKKLKAVTMQATGGYVNLSHLKTPTLHSQWSLRARAHPPKAQYCPLLVTTTTAGTQTQSQHLMRQLEMKFQEAFMLALRKWFFGNE